MGKAAYNVYSAEAMERYKTMLENNADNGKAKYFAIEVDGLKVVDKTNNTEEFDNYELFITDETKEVLILLYSTSPTSPKHDKHFLRMEKKTEQKVETPIALSGVEIQNQINTGIQAERERWERLELEKEKEKLKSELKDAEEYIEKLEEKCAEYERNRNNLKGVHLGQIAGVAFETVLRNNVRLLSKIPITKDLAGLIASDTEQKLLQDSKTDTPDSEVSFSTTELSEEDKLLMNLLKDINTHFSESEIKDVMGIIGLFAQEHSYIETVKDLLTTTNKN